MVRKVILISVLIATVAVVSHGQVIDTTRKINTWMLKHNYTRFEEVQLDTNTHQLQRDYNPVYKEGFSYESAGILAHAVNHVDFTLRPDPSTFLFGRAWEPYLKTPERTIFFNTKTPFTSLFYSTNLFVNKAPEENIEAIHTQNASPFSNFGIDFNILAGKPYYTNQETRANRVGLFGSHAKDRYSIFGTFYYNNFVAYDNGGITDVDSFLEATEDDWWLYDVNLEEAKSRYRNLSFFATQKYNLVERQTSTDSLGNTSSRGKTLSLSHQLLIESQLKVYKDVVDLDSLSPVYRNYYYEVPAAFDSASEDLISNVFQVILGDPDYDKISARIQAGYEFRRFGMLSPQPQEVFSHLDSTDNGPLVIHSVYRDSAVADFNHTYFNDVYLGFHLAGPTTGIWDWVIDGKYYMLGYNQNNFNLHATFSRELGGKTDLGLRGSFESTRPHYFSNNYSSSFFEWDNDFPSTLRIKGEAFILSEEMETNIRLGVSYISNYIYWDQDALPSLYDKDLLVLTAHLSKHFKFSGFNSDSRLLLQYTTANEVLRLPVASVYSSNYWKQSLFKGALVADLGFDLFYTTKYRASAYMPATGIFHLQDEADVGGYPFLDVFLSFRIKTTRMFFSYNNVLHGLGFVGNNFFTTYTYPMKPRHFRLGLVWYFYD
jgi:Putative porin